MSPPTKRVNAFDEPNDYDLDDLNITKHTSKRLGLDLGSFISAGDDHEDSTTADEAISTGSPDNTSPSTSTRPRALARHGEKITWDSENDRHQTQLQRRKRKRKSKGKGKGKGKGHKPLPKSPATGTRPDQESSEDELPDEVLPTYLRHRKSAFEAQSQCFGNPGLRLPPVHDDIHFKHHEHLHPRPDFVNTAPRALCEDVELYSHGPLPSKENKTAAHLKIGVLPASLAQWLREYQVQGAHFLLERFVWQQGCILGDDMGLGKTIQVIAFLTAAFGKSADKRDVGLRRKLRALRPAEWYPRILIICPGSLMDNWENELATWGYWEVNRFHGSAEKTAECLSSAKNGSVEIVITTYGMYRRNHSSLNLVEWDCVIADECHTIKDRRAEITKAMNQINALCRIGLSGTAIQNNYDELWTLLNWANPGAVSSLASWKQLISNPLRIGQAHDATTYQHGIARRTAEALKNELLPRFFLRRWKTLIADQLPKKRDRIVFCPLTSTQSKAYQRFLDSEEVRIVRTATDYCDCGSKKKRGWCCHTLLPDSKPWQSFTFPAIMTLLNISNHLALLIPPGMDEKDKSERAKSVLQLALPDQWQQMMRQKDSIDHLNNQAYCGKWAVLLKSLKWWYDHGDKVLIFSHSVKLLRGLKLLFSATSYNYSYLDGSMSYEERTEAVNSFNTDKHQFVFLISIRAGGVGLNITSANKVVILDPNWNPSHDLQAQDRAYRIGQTRDVDVFRLISVGTIEEIVYARQIYKQQQADIAYKASLERRYFTGVQDNPEKKGELFGIANLFSYQPDHVVLQKIVNDTNIAESKAGILVTDVDFQSQPVDETPENDELLVSSSDDKVEDNLDPAVKVLADIINCQADVRKQGRAKTNTQRKAGVDGIEHILAQAGVQYFHENSEVIGTSKVESRLSRRAMERTTDLDADDEVIFARGLMSNNAISVPEDCHARQPVSLEISYRPPQDVRTRQFCSMAQSLGLSATRFAIEVEAWTQKKRRDFLDRFYEDRRSIVSRGSPTT